MTKKRLGIWNGPHPDRNYNLIIKDGDRRVGMARSLPEAKRKASKEQKRIGRPVDIFKFMGRMETIGKYFKKKRRKKKKWVKGK